MSNNFQGTIRDEPNFHANRTADALEMEMKGFGCDEERIYKEIVHVSNKQRQMVRDYYTRKYGKDLMNELQRELYGDFKRLIIALMETPLKFDITQLHQAMEGLGTHESTLIDIICTRTDEAKRELKQAYQEEYGKSLEEDVVDDTSGHFQDLLVSLLQCKRDTDNTVNESMATQDALLLMGSPQDNIKPDITTFHRAFASQSYAQLKKLFQEYELFTEDTIQECIRRTFSGDARDAYLAVADSLESTPKYFARRLYESMEGLGTSDRDLIYILVSRSEIDLADIKKQFDATYNEDLLQWIQSDCSGAYRDVLIAIINGNS